MGTPSCPLPIAEPRPEGAAVRVSLSRCSRWQRPLPPLAWGITIHKSPKSRPPQVLRAVPRNMIVSRSKRLLYVLAWLVACSCCRVVPKHDATHPGR